MGWKDVLFTTGYAVAVGASCVAAIGSLRGGEEEAGIPGGNVTGNATVSALKSGGVSPFLLVLEIIGIIGCGAGVAVTALCGGCGCSNCSENGAGSTGYSMAPK